MVTVRAAAGQGLSGQGVVRTSYWSQFRRDDRRLRGEVAEVESGPSEHHVDVEGLTLAAHIDVTAGHRRHPYQGAVGVGGAGGSPAEPGTQTLNISRLAADADDNPSFATTMTTKEQDRTSRANDSA